MAHHSAPFPVRACLIVTGILLAALSGCTSKEADAAALLPDSIFAAQIPMFPGAKYESAMGGNYYGGVGGPVTGKSQSWFFNVSEPAEKVIGFYSEKLPNAERTSDGDETVFEFEPQGGKPGEKVRVRIEPGKLQITERLSGERAIGSDE
ncbi:MAG TPA: hypothetical protein VFD71_14005 [Planctomycetota bacterium]|nr:hypothetical protein [Planctomycetota bacterium]